VGVPRAQEGAMIIPDVNLLLYANIIGFPEHQKARAWWEAALNGDREIGLAAPVLFGFIRIATNPRVPQFGRGQGPFAGRQRFFSLILFLQVRELAVADPQRLFFLRVEAARAERRCARWSFFDSDRPNVPERRGRDRVTTAAGSRYASTRIPGRSGAASRRRR
jgi:hypothetical protein